MHESDPKGFAVVEIPVDGGAGATRGPGDIVHAGLGDALTEK